MPPSRKYFSALMTQEFYAESVQKCFAVFVNDVGHAPAPWAFCVYDEISLAVDPVYRNRCDLNSLVSVIFDHEIFQLSSIFELGSAISREKLRLSDQNRLTIPDVVHRYANVLNLSAKDIFTIGSKKISRLRTYKELTGLIAAELELDDVDADKIKGDVGDRRTKVTQIDQKWYRLWKAYDDARNCWRVENSDFGLIGYCNSEEAKNRFGCVGYS